MRRALLVLFLFLAGCGPKGLQAKLQFAERRAGELETELDKAERAMADLDPEEAQEHLDESKKALLEPDLDYYPEHGLLRDRYKALDARLPSVRAEKERRDFEAKVAQRRQALQKVLAELDKAMDALAKKDISSSDVAEANDAREDVEEELKEGKALEGKDAKYTSDAEKARQTLEKGLPRVKLAHQTVQFLKGPGALHHEALELAREAKAEKELEDRLEAFLEARNAYRKCQDGANQLLGASAGLEKVAILLDEHTTTPRAVALACTDGAASTEKTLVALREKAKAAAAKKAQPKAARTAAKAPAKKRR